MILPSFEGNDARAKSLVAGWYDCDEALGYTQRNANYASRSALVHSRARRSDGQGAPISEAGELRCADYRCLAAPGGCHRHAQR
jgi:hypothetical protein